jgi:type IV pilus assembly protein PilB
MTPGETIWKGKGCDACGMKGVKGRVGIYEVMKMSARLRKMIAAAALTEEIHAAAVEEGMLDLKAYSAWLIRQGLTTVEEVLQVVSVQE